MTVLRIPKYRLLPQRCATAFLDEEKKQQIIHLRVKYHKKILVTYKSEQTMIY
jgi:hypothetical protein